MAIYLAPAALGLGDLVVTLPVVQQLIALGEPVFLVVRAEEHQELARRIPGLAGTRLEWELPGCLSQPDRFIDMRDHPLQREFWWGSKPFLDKYPGWRIEDVLRVICKDKKLPADFAQPYEQLHFVRRNELAGKVLFIPGSAVSAKCWPTANWLAVSQQVDAVVIGQPEESEEARALIDAGLAWYETPSVADALDAVSSCQAVISVDTGIMHMAVHQGTPTVGIYRGSAVYLRERENFIGLVPAKSCDAACFQAELDCAHNDRPAAGKGFRPLNWSCQSVDSSCISEINPEAVLQALCALTDRHGRRHPQTSNHPLPAQI